VIRLHDARREFVEEIDRRGPPRIAEAAPQSLELRLRRRRAVERRQFAHRTIELSIRLPSMQTTSQAMEE